MRLDLRIWMASIMKRQLRHFKRGVRGAHEDDTGAQMAPMAMMLADAAAINVVSYIGTLSGQADFDGSSGYSMTNATERSDLSNSSDPTRVGPLCVYLCSVPRRLG